MYIITVASTKGGVGKSTLVLNLATTMQNLGQKVAILDADAQSTISKWQRVREYKINQGERLAEIFVVSARGEALLEIANDKKKQGYFVFIDSPGADDANMRAALLRSDFVISICPPSPVDLWEVETLLNILKKLQALQNRKLPSLLVFNKVPTRFSNLAVSDSLQFFEQNNLNLSHILSALIKERVVYKHSIRDGKGIIEFSPPDLKATQEIMACCQEILSIIKSYDRQ